MKVGILKRVVASLLVVFLLFILLCGCETIPVYSQERVVYQDVYYRYNGVVYHHLPGRSVDVIVYQAPHNRIILHRPPSYIRPPQYHYPAPPRFLPPPRPPIAPPSQMVPRPYLRPSPPSQYRPPSPAPHLRPPAPGGGSGSQFKPPAPGGGRFQSPGGSSGGFKPSGPIRGIK